MVTWKGCLVAEGGQRLKEADQYGEGGRGAGQGPGQSQSFGLGVAGVGQGLQPCIALPLPLKLGPVCKPADAKALPLILHPIPCVHPKDYISLFFL